MAVRQQKLQAITRTTIRPRSHSLPREFAWLKQLDSDEQASFFSGLLARVLNALKTNQWSSIEEWIEEWKATANIYADTKVAESIERGRAELARGEAVDWDALRQELGV